MNLARFDALLHPGHHRSTIIRRVLALVLVVVAGLSMLIDAHRADPSVLIFARPVAAGAVLTEEDLTTTRLPSNVVPANAIQESELATGQILAAGASAGEVVTTTRLVGPDLIAQLVAEEPPGEDFTMVPLPLAEPDIVPMLHHGARVDVVGHGPAVIAEGGRIVTVGEEGTVLVLLRKTHAAAVAAASLVDPLTVVLSGGGYSAIPQLKSAR